jgi:hypothetical protein
MASPGCSDSIFCAARAQSKDSFRETGDSIVLRLRRSPLTTVIPLLLEGGFAMSHLPTPRKIEIAHAQNHASQAYNTCWRLFTRLGV